MVIKNILTCLLSLLFTGAVSAQQTDIKECGLKGKVKSITTMHYRNVRFSNGQWIPNSPDKFDFLTTWHFNEQGNIDTAKNTLFIEPDSQITNLLVFEFENNKKVAAKFYIFGGILTELYKISWLNQYTYNTVARDTNGLKTYEATSWLNKNLRDSKCKYKIYEKGKLVIYEKYADFLDKNDLLIKAKFTNLLEKQSYFVSYLHSEFDSYNNPTSTTQLNTTTGIIKEMTIRTITYYE